MQESLTGHPHLRSTSSTTRRDSLEAYARAGCDQERSGVAGS
jgi:hypothetical protein